MITHDHQLIFVHIPKCAGRSVCDVFCQRFDHYTAQFYESEYSKHWQRYQRMTIVRHPLDRFVSLYIYILNHRRHKQEPIGDGIVHPINLPLHESVQSNFSRWLIKNINAFQGDFGYHAEGARGTDGDLGSSFWFTSQWKRIISRSGQCDLHRVFKLEDGNAPINDYLSEITGTPVVLPHTNKSEYSDWRSFYNGEAYALASTFPAVVEDARNLGYDL